MYQAIVLLVFLVVIVFIFIQRDIVRTTSYNVPGYKELTDAVKFTEGGIPKIIIKSSWQKRDAFPIQMKQALERIRLQNPEYSLYYFDDDEVDAFMKNFSADAYYCYNKLKPSAFKSDLFRICFLYKYGGCYGDIGHVMNTTFDDVCRDYQVVFVKDFEHYKFWNGIGTGVPNGIYNAFMCTVKNNPFFKLCIERCCENIRNEYYGNFLLDITGPTFMGKMFIEHIGNDIERGGYYLDQDRKIRMLVWDHFSISDEQGNNIIFNKFDDYHNVMYVSRSTKKYGQLYRERDVYK
jgi:Glycosyltransferase sugar-binding region containing DXD motif